MSSKRKAASSGVELDTPDSKRQKIPPADAETPQSTTVAGLAFLDNIRQTRDKRGRLIATEFLTLPDRALIPEYYDIITLPVALDTIEAKLRRNEYPTLTTVESDLKRMIANAKQFNEKSSEIHNDAEKMRKSINGKMRAINPAYFNPDYMAFATPLPDENVDTPASDRKSEELAAEAIEQKKPRLKLGAPSAPKEVSKITSLPQSVRPSTGTRQSFNGKSFQQAQEQLIAEMMDLEDENNNISGAFIQLPPRNLVDYYQVIKNPISLKQVEKKIKGVKGKERATGISLYKTWQSMEEDMVRIWENARIYNEDGSQISDDAGKLERYFVARVAQAKAAVKEPAAPSIKLRLGQKDIPQQQQQPHQKLRINMRVPNNGTNGVTVDTAALKRQQELVAAGANGHAPSPTSAISGATRSGSAASPPVAADGIKAEHSATRSPAPQMMRNGSTGSGSQAASASMPPPASTTPRLPSGSPHPQIYRPPPPPAPVSPIDQRMRAPGKGIADALIANLVIRTHPGLNIADRFRLAIPPSPKRTQQSITINLPQTHHSLIIEPTFASVPPYRMGKPIITVNDYPAPGINLAPEENPHNHSFEARVRPGLNKIDVEMITGPARGAPKIGTGPEIEYEKTTILVNVFT